MHAVNPFSAANLRLLVATGTLCVTAASVTAQSRKDGVATAYSQQSAALALGVVQHGIDALGGTAALRRISTITRDMSGPRTDVGQGGMLSEFVPTYSEIGHIPKPVNESRTISVRDLRRLRSSEHVRYSIYGGQKVDRRAVIADSEAFNAYYDYIYRGIRTLPAATLARTRAAAFRRHPESLLLGALGRPEALRSLGSAQFGGKNQDVLSYVDGDGTLLAMFFDAGTHRLTKTETLGEDGVLGDLASETIYLDYRPVRDVVLPFHYIDKRAGVVQDDQRASSIVLDAPMSDTLFRRPAGLDVVDFGLPFPNVQRLGHDVYAVLGGYNTIFVVFNDHVVVLEAGGSVREAETVIAKIKETAPGKPIRYVIATHWNFDHLGGVRPYVAEGATFIAPKSAHPVIERAVTAVRPLHPDALSRNPRPAMIETLGDRERTFTDGTHTVMVYNISPTPHVNEMYIAYLPTERTLFEADLLDIIVPGKTGSAGDDTADLAKKISGLGLQVDRIVPVHGQMGTMDDLRQSLSRRAEMPAATPANAQRTPGPAAASGQTGDEKAVRAVLHDWLDALLHNDMAALERIIAPDYTITAGGGRVMNREEDLEVVKSGKVHFQSADVDSVNVRIFGEAAVVTGVGRYTVTMGDKTSTVRERFTDVYARREGRWQPVASHTTPLRN